MVGRDRKGGIGKSRLVYEWLKRLPNDWFGFFARSDADPEMYLRLSPLSDTVIVFDYIIGNETDIARVLTVLRQRFGCGRYKLRIVMIERHCDSDKHNWVDDVFKCIDIQDQIAFDNAMCRVSASSGAKDGGPRHKGTARNGDLDPLRIKALLREEELAVIESYMGTYLDKVADDVVKDRYVGTTDAMSPCAADILTGFHEALPEEYSRPLFLAIYTELWIYKDGAVDVDGINGILEAFLHKEEDRWRGRLGNSNALLNDYVKLLALASATELVCLDDEQGFYQGADNNLMAFLEVDRQPGKRQKDYSDLFIWQEYARDYSSVDRIGVANDEGLAAAQEEIRRIGSDDGYIRLDEHGRPKLLTLIDPRYPDIIKEFLVDFYIPEQEWVPFAQAARLGSNLSFEMFLSRALDDFPECDSYMKMALAPIEDKSDLFGKAIFFLLNVERLVEHGRIGQITDDLCASDAHTSVIPFEMETWRRLGIVLTDKGKLDELYEAGLKSAAYLANRIEDKNTRDFFPDVMQSFLIGLHNAKRPWQMSGLLAKYEEAASKALDDGIATCLVEHYVYLSVLWMRAKDEEQTCACWNKLMGLWEKFPSDTDNLELIAKSTEDFYDFFDEGDILERCIRLVGDLEKIFDATKEAGAPNADVANALAVREANEHSKSYGQLGVGLRLEARYSDGDRQLAGVIAPTGATDIIVKWRMRSAERRIEELYGIFPYEEGVVLGYAYLLFHKNTFGRPRHAKIDDSVLRLFKDWIDRYPDAALELNEFYARILLEKWMDARDLEDISEANRIYFVLFGIANRLEKQFPEVENEVRAILDSGVVRRL